MCDVPCLFSKYFEVYTAICKHAIGLHQNHLTIRMCSCMIKAQPCSACALSLTQPASEHPRWVLFCVLLWNFPNCEGAHSCPPPGTRSTHDNFKLIYSIVLMALVNSCYSFLYVYVGCNGWISDGGVFGGCTLHDPTSQQQNIQHPRPCTTSWFWPAGSVLLYCGRWGISPEGVPDEAVCKPQAFCSATGF